MAQARTGRGGPAEDIRKADPSAVRQRRPRDPVETRNAILRAACTLLAKDGPEAISLSEVAHLAGVNRGTAYQHFATREKLIAATAAWVSNEMFRAVFASQDRDVERPIETVDVADTVGRLVSFAMANPELGRIWLLQVLASPDPSTDPFWREFAGSLKRFTRTDLAEPGIDAEVLSVIMLAGTFLWPVWAQAHAHAEKDRRALTERFTSEVLRLSLNGTMRAECFPDIAQQLQRARKSGRGER